ncbi:efflux RND transporter periplasmic adaptor subunit [Neptunomonas sp.]|uniref:efflux RND transporter periplasmic adaptor subunit n=1 Tax=Neptunomonas TaxID=75687 RepID=UPI003513E617
MNASTRAPESAEATLATLVHLIRRARQACKANELRFILVNESHALVPYRQAAFWSCANGVEALSGVTSPEQQAPYIQWLNRWFKAKHVATKVTVLNSDLNSLAANQRDEWAEWLPPYLITIDIPALKNFDGGRLLLAREQPFSKAEMGLVSEWVDAWSDQYAIHTPKRLSSRLGVTRTFKQSLKWPIRLCLFAGLTIIALLPVRLTVLAPAELVPLEPAIIRAPMDGIIDRILVEPNQRINVGTPLFAFDTVSLASRLEVAERSLNTAQTEYRQSAQRALYDPDSKSKLSVMQSQIEEQRVEVNYLRTLNTRSGVVSPRAGLVILDDPSAFVGRPVMTGERIMVVADENKTQIEAWLSPSDMIQFPKQTKVTFYLAADPINPISATVSYIAHQPELRPEGNYAYRLRAQLTDTHNERPRVGLKGTAKLFGDEVSIAYWIFRRPWAALRGWIGI